MARFGDTSSWLVAVSARVSDRSARRAGPIGTGRGCRCEPVPTAPARARRARCTRTTLTRRDDECLSAAGGRARLRMPRSCPDAGGVGVLPTSSVVRRRSRSSLRARLQSSTFEPASTSPTSPLAAPVRRLSLTDVVRISGPAVSVRRASGARRRMRGRRRSHANEDSGAVV